MLTSQLYDANGQQLGELGFSFSDIWDGIKSAVGSTVGAVKGVADVACDAASTIGPGGANLIAGFNKDAGYITGQAVNYCQTYNQFTQPSAPTTTFPSAAAFPPAAAPFPATPVTPTVPAGTITAFSAKRGMWRVAVPRGAHLGAFGALGADPPFTEVTPTSTPPTGATQVTEPALDQQIGQSFFRLNNPWMWVAIGGGAAALGTGGYFLFRRKHV